MPGMNGRDLYDEVRRRRPGIRCVYMSGYTADVLAPQGVVDDGVHFLQKPFHIQALARTVRNVLDDCRDSGLS